MALAVSNPQNAFAKLEELQAKAKEVEQKFQQERERIDAEHSQVIGNIIAEIKMTADSLTLSVPVPKATKTPVPTPVAKVPLKKNTNGHSVAKRGRPKGSKNRPKVETKVESKSEESPSSMDLKDAILHVLSNRNLWGHVKNLSPQANGLKVSEIYKVIEAEKLWKTESKSPEIQVSQRLGDLRSDEKVVRGDEMRYRLA